MEWNYGEYEALTPSEIHAKSTRVDDFQTTAALAGKAPNRLAPESIV